MKKVVFIRHAKSSWDTPFVADSERNLANRGRRDAPLMARFLKSLIPTPDIILSSHARRAVQTAAIFAEELKYPEIIRIHNELYLNGTNSYVNAVARLSPEIQTALVFGHNPDLHQLVSFLGTEDIGKFPTCALALFEIETKNWSNWSSFCTPSFFMTPKKLTEL